MSAPVSIDAHTFVAVLEEYAALLADGRQQLEHCERRVARELAHSGVVEAFLYDKGFTIADAEAAWKAKGYGLGY